MDVVIHLRKILIDMEDNAYTNPEDGLQDWSTVYIKDEELEPEEERPSNGSVDPQLMGKQETGVDLDRHDGGSLFLYSLTPMFGLPATG